MPTARFEADFSGFINAINGAQMKLVDFNKGAENVETTLNDMTDKFSGRALIQEASLMTIAIEKLGGTSMLTADELENVGNKANDAVAKLQAMGSDVPAGLQKLADATRDNVSATTDWSSALSTLTGVLGAMGISASLSGLVSFVKEIGNGATEIDNLAKRMQTTSSEVQRFQTIASQTGVPVGTMASAMEQLSAKVGAGDDGVIGRLNQLGITLDQFKGQTTYQNFVQIAEGIAKITDREQENTAGTEVFGKAYKTLLPAIQQGIDDVGHSTEQMSGGTTKYWADSTTAAGKFWTDFKAGFANAHNEIWNVNKDLDEFKAALASIPVPKLFTPDSIAKVAGSLIDTTMAAKDLTDQTTALAKADEAWLKSVADVDAQTADWHKTLDTLDGTVVDSAEHLLQLGVNAKTVQTYFDLSDAAMIALQKDIKEGGPAIAAAFQDAADATKNWHDRLNDLDGEVVEGAKYYLDLGLKVHEVSLIMQQSEKDIQAVSDSMKTQQAATLSIAKIWNDYTDIVGSGSETAYQKATAAIDKWYADDIAKHQQSKTDTAEYYDAIAALDDAKYAQLATNRLAADKDSKTYLDNQAKAAADAYQFALAQDGQFSQEHIQKLRDAADASALAAARWGTAWDDAGTTAAGSVDKVTGAVAKTTQAVYALGQAGTAGEAQAMSSALAEVNKTNVGQMIQQGTQSIDLMNQYEALIEAAMAARGYSVGGGLTPAAQNAGYGGTSVNTTVNVNTPLGTPSQISTAVSSALSSSLRQSGVLLPSQ